MYILKMFCKCINKCTMFYKHGMTTEEIYRALAELEDDDIEVIFVAIIPPPMDVLMEEEDVNDENIPEETIFQ